MAETKPIQIFFCHASEDKAEVEAIYDRLKGLGYKPWLDKKDLLPGQRWASEIPKAIRASDYILIFLSKTSVAKRGYVQNEFKLALEVLRSIPEGTIYAIPVRLDDCPIPDQFADLHWCNLFEADGFEYLLRALQVGRPSPEVVGTTPQSRSLGHAIPMQPKHDVTLTRQPFEPEMILIPAGEFLMGSDPQQDKTERDDEQPQHRLYLPDYYLAKTPVTEAQYRAFLLATGHEARYWRTNRAPPSGEDDYPVVDVTWYDARDYCQWLSKATGKSYSLPSEAEWEKGARGTDSRIYPWGNQWDGTWCNAEKGLDDKTTTVGAFPQGASPYGLMDMAGNIEEWTRSLWAQGPSLIGKAKFWWQQARVRRAIHSGDRERLDRMIKQMNLNDFKDMMGSPFTYPYNPNDGREKLNVVNPICVVRGGTFYYSQVGVRCASRGRDLPNSSSRSLGFRVVVRPAS